MISEQEWRRDASTIAAIIPKEMLADRWLFWKKFNVRPGEAALWISNGKVLNIISEEQGVSSGAIDRLKSKFGAGQDMFVMMLDTSERILSFRVGLDKSAIKSSSKELYDKLEEIENKEEPENRSAQQNELTNILSNLQETIEMGLQEEQSEQTFRKAMAEAQAIKDERERYRMTNFVKYRWYIYTQINERSAILTNDRESVIFDVRLIVSFRPENAAEIYKLMKGYHWLEEDQLNILVRNELETRVFHTMISKYTAEELRGNLDIMKQLHKQSKDELFEWLQNYGMQLNRININPAITDAECAAVFDKEYNAIALAAARKHKRELSQTERDYELELHKVKLEAKLKQAEKESDEETQKIIRAAFLSDKEKDLSAQEIDSKISQIKKETELKAKEKEQELRLLGIKREWDVDKEKMLAQTEVELQKKTTEVDLEIRKTEAETQAEIEKMRALAEEHRKIKAQKNEAKLQEIAAKRDTAQIEHQHVQKVLEIGAQANALNGSVMSEALRQETMRKALEQGDKTAQAYSQAEGQRYAKENFQQGLASGPNIGVAGQGRVFVQPQIPGGQPQIPGSPPLLNSGQDQQPTDQTKMTACADCRQLIPSDSNFCGHCGKPIKDENDSQSTE